MPAHGKLLVIELVLPPGEEPFVGKWLDLQYGDSNGSTRLHKEHHYERTVALPGHLTAHQRTIRR